MHTKPFYCAGKTEAVQYAAQELQALGFPIAGEPLWNTRHLLLDVPSFRNDTTLRSGGRIDTLLGSLPKTITIWGGNLQSPAVAGYDTVDLLKDEPYLVQNASITADCALMLAEPMLNGSWQESPALVIGWGRIGKFLYKLLREAGCHVTVASGTPASRAVLEAKGISTTDYEKINVISPEIRILFNTVPAVILPEEDAHHWQHCIKIDLASHKGIEGADVLWARGLPGIHAPKESGRLIAQTIARLWKERNP